MASRKKKETTSKDTKEKFWLYAFRDHLANLHAYTNCIETADVNGDGDYKLLVADGGKRLKTYSGTSLSSEARLLGVPSAVACFYMDSQATPLRRPVVAIATGPYIFMYFSGSPLYRFTVPAVRLDPEEVQIWADLSSGALAIDEGVKLLENKLNQGVEVSSRTLEMLLIDNPAERTVLLERVKNAPLKQFDVITCMSSIQLYSLDEGEPGALVYGTERRMLCVLHSNASELALQVRLPSVPVYIICAGTFSSDYRIIVSCRNGRIYSIKEGGLHSSVIQPDAQPSAMTRYDNLIAVATMAQTLTYFNLKGKRQETIHLPVAATNLTTIIDTATGAARGIVAALSNGEIRVYVGKHLQHVSQAYGTVTAMKYCRYGREDAALILVLQNGSLVVELLHRNAKLTSTVIGASGPPAEQGVPIPVPQLSSVFALQTEREKMHGADMYRTFQFDLCCLRLNTAKLYASMISAGALPEMVAPTAAGVDDSIRIVATVQGLGPVYKIKSVVQNVGDAPHEDVIVAFLYDAEMYEMPRSLFNIPYLVPGLTYPCDALISLREGEVKGENVRCVVVGKDTARPLCTTVVDLPEADLVEGL